MTIIDTKEFLFETVSDYSKEIQDGSQILNWMDSEIKKSSFIDIECVSILAEESGAIKLVYIVVDIGKLNQKYSIRHIALQEINKN